MKPISKEKRRALMPECSAFIDDMRQAFDVTVIDENGDEKIESLMGIDATENGQSVKWGEDFGECVEFPLTSKDMK
jgi:hypothetical protein